MSKLLLDFVSFRFASSLFYAILISHPYQSIIHPHTQVLLSTLIHTESNRKIYTFKNYSILLILVCLAIWTCWLCCSMLAVCVFFFPANANFISVVFFFRVGDVGWWCWCELIKDLSLVPKKPFEYHFQCDGNGNASNRQKREWGRVCMCEIHW